MKTLTERVYYTYASGEPFRAQILEAGPGSNGSAIVVLDKTIFFPSGGGQPSDRGSINGIALLDVFEKDGKILHVLSPDSGRFPVPGPAELILDRRRRRLFSQLHSGQHLLSALILRMCGAPTISMHLGDETCTIDIDTRQCPAPAAFDEEMLAAIEDRVADAIEANHPVNVHLCPPRDITAFKLRRPAPAGEEVIRVIEIEGCDVIACCGTHVTSTAEIGLFRVYGAEKYKGMMRVTFSAGRRLLEESRLLRQNAVVVSRALSVPVNETGKGVNEYLRKNAESEARLKTLCETLVRLRADALVRRVAGCGSGAGVFAETYCGANIQDVINVGKIVQKEIEAAQAESGAAIILASVDDLKFAAFSSVKGADLQSLLKEKLAFYNGKGGGSSSFFQGGFSTEEALNAFLAAVCNGGLAFDAEGSFQ